MDMNVNETRDENRISEIDDFIARRWLNAIGGGDPRNPAVLNTNQRLVDCVEWRIESFALEESHTEEM
jgi:hypothetical protein